MSSEASRVTLIGLGNMGAALAKAQLGAGAKVTVWNRTPDRPSVSSLVSAGARFEPSAEKAIEASPITIFCLLDNPSMRQVLEPVFSEKTNSLKGKTIVNLTNGTPREAREMGELLRSHGLEAYMDGGIMAGPEMIGTPESFILLSGANEEKFQENKALLEVFGALQYFGEDPGAASLHDLASLAGLYGMIAGTLTGISLLRRAKPPHGHDKPPLETPTTEFMVPLMQAFLYYNGRMAKAVESDEFPNDVPHEGYPLGMVGVSMDNIAKACEEEGVDCQLLQNLFQLVNDAAKEGYGENGVAVVVSKLLKR